MTKIAKRQRQRTTRRRSLERPGELVIAFRPFIASYVKMIHSDGLHGMTLEHTVDRLLCDQLLYLEKKGWIAQLMQSDAGELVRLRHLSRRDDAQRLRWFATRTTTLDAREKNELRRIAARLGAKDHPRKPERPPA